MFHPVDLGIVAALSMLVFLGIVAAWSMLAPLCIPFPGNPIVSTHATIPRLRSLYPFVLRIACVTVIPGCCLFFHAELEDPLAVLCRGRGAHRRMRVCTLSVDSPATVSRKCPLSKDQDRRYDKLS
eukprot:2672997-Rhodomonas_salina.2